MSSEIKSKFSQAYSSLLCTAHITSFHCPHSLLVFLWNYYFFIYYYIFIIPLSNIFVCQYVVFFLECPAASLSNMPHDSDGLIFISPTNLATSKHHSMFPLFPSLMIALQASFFQEKKWKGMLGLCHSAGTVAWGTEKSESQETWVLVLVLPLTGHEMLDKALPHHRP